MFFKTISLIFLVMLLNGCANKLISSNKSTLGIPLLEAIALWPEIAEGKIEGKIILQWVEADKFIYISDKEKPLKFIRGNGEVIQPTPIYTDGGSIPRAARVIKGFSPWNFTPAFIVHDWLFELKHCNDPEAYKYGYEKAARIMAEIVKTQMIAEMAAGESERGLLSNQILLYNIYIPVLKFSESLWDKGVCEFYEESKSTTS